MYTYIHIYRSIYVYEWWKRGNRKKWNRDPRIPINLIGEAFYTFSYFLCKVSHLLKFSTK